MVILTRTLSWSLSISDIDKNLSMKISNFHLLRISNVEMWNEKKRRRKKGLK